MNHDDCLSVLPRLGLENLPDRIGQLAIGMIYGITCGQQSLRLPLVAGALSASLESGKRCALVTALDPGMFLRKARLSAFELEPHMRSGALTIFHLAPDAAKHMFRSGTQGFLRELELNFPGRGAFLVFDSADPLFMLSDPQASAEAAQRYLEWLVARDHTLLAMFAPAGDAPRDYLALRLVADNFGGFAVVKAGQGSAILDVRHWFGVQGAVPPEVFPLWAQPSGVLLAQPPAQSGDDLPPVDSVIFVRGAIHAAGAAGRPWQEVESIADAVDAARRSEAATLVLPFLRPGDYEILCRAIVTVRAMGRPSLRVVVRERQLRLRASQTLALMRLGASAVITLDVADGAAKRMIGSLQGTRFARSYDMDAQQVDAETAGPLRGMAASAFSFCDAIERLLAAADDYEIDSCLARIELAEGDCAAPPRLAARLGRDLLAFERDACTWVFLFGCTSRTAPAVLERLLEVSPAALASRACFEDDAGRIVVELNRLRERRAERAPALLQ